ncbi:MULTISPECIES: MarR family transcriptional regulator [unclassified Fusobacterium]|uniref:MarR family transcriptional regulator n=1 Tax=unclassified Fusobacterium TaxID=2648384 RepID=UPI0026392ABA|nr:MarR family transcriptional regulator [Fusobacterium sp.]
MKKISSKVIKKFFNLIEDSKEFYKDFLKSDRGEGYIPEIYLEMQEFVYANDKYMSSLKEGLNGELNFADYNHIYCIGSSEKINITQLSKKIKNSKGYTSKVIKKLLMLRYIRTYQEEGNKKDVYIELTKNGRIAYEEICDKIENIEKDFYQFLWENFSEEELKFLYSFFIKINKFQNEQITKL